MMDFGFGAFLEKFESYFGKGITRVLLMLIGLAITSATCSLIWHTALEPIIKAMVDDFPARPKSGILNIVWLSSIIGGGMAIGFATMAGISHLLMGAFYRRALVNTRKRQSEINGLLDRAENVAERTREAYSANVLVFDEFIKLAVSRGIFTQSLADEFLSLINTVEETQP